jgi:hypothetical protein
MNISLQELVRRVPDNTEKRINQVRKRAGAVLRDAIRQETGLLLNRRSLEGSQTAQRDRSVSVPVKLEPGMPESLRWLKFEDDFWIIAILSRCRRALVSSANSSKQLDELFSELSGHRKGAEILQARHKHLSPLSELVDHLLEIVDKADPVKQILQVNEDVLGLYRYQLSSKGMLYNHDPLKGEVVLYWGIIGLIAGFLGILSEDLVVVVMAHEIAHAYTHLGSDIDGERWNAGDFSHSDHGLKEGLAQYYTHRICLRLQNQFPKAHDAYTSLLQHQPEAYKTHIRWIKNNTPEEVRLAMLETRREGVGKINDFNAALSEAKSSLNKRNHKSQRRF